MVEDLPTKYEALGSILELQKHREPKGYRSRHASWSCGEELHVVCHFIGGYPVFLASFIEAAVFIQCVLTSLLNNRLLQMFGVFRACYTIPGQRDLFSRKKFQKADFQPPLILKIKGFISQSRRWKQNRENSGTQEGERSLLTTELGWTVKTIHTETILLFG